VEGGGKPYTIPIGGSNVIGATGYVTCAQEILQQSFDLGIEMNHVLRKWKRRDAFGVSRRFYSKS
jgi:1-aminocyclopropane-1-carboxylate deaminase/D-cysteine desulfhydrase-like pyridoxal-dependent ACC family enzyme